MDEIFLPPWDKLLQQNTNSKVWNPDLHNKSQLKVYQLIESAFPNDSENFFLSFLCFGRNYFAPPSTEDESYKMLENMEGKRVKVFFALKKANHKHVIGNEWFLLKKMHHKERLYFSKKFLDYQTFIRFSGQAVIVKSGTQKSAFNLLYNNKFLIE